MSGSEQEPEPRLRTELPLSAEAAGWVVLLLAFGVLRALAHSQMSASVFGSELILDALAYHDLAGRFAAGQWQQQQAFFLGPGWPALLGCWYAIAGAESAMGRLLNVGLSLGVLVLGGAFARRMGGPVAGLSAGSLWVFYGPALFHEQTLLMEVGAGLFTLLAAMALWFAVRSSAPDAPAPAWRTGLLWLAAGLLLGVSATFRATVLAALPVFLVGALLPLWRERRAVRAVWPLALVAGLAAAIAPAAIHNARAEGVFIPIASNFGLNLYIGNSPDANGTYYSPPTVQAEERGLLIAKAVLGRESLNSKEISAFWSTAAQRYMADNPARVVALAAWRAMLLVAARELPQLYFPERMRAELPILAWGFVGFGVVLPLAVAGAIMMSKSAGVEGRLLVAALILVLLAMLPFFITGRYRLPVAPLMIVMAGVAVAGAVRWLRLPAASRRIPRLEVAAAVVAAALSWGPWTPEDPRLAIRFDEMHAAVLLKAGERERALALLESIAREDLAAEGLSNRAKLLEELRGDFAGASELYRLAIQRDAFDPRLWFNAAQAFLRTGALPAAADAYEKSLAVGRDLPDEGLFNLAVLRAQAGNFAGSRLLLERLIQRRPGDAQAQALLARLPRTPGS